MEEQSQATLDEVPTSSFVTTMEEIGNLSQTAEKLKLGNVYAARDRDGQVHLLDTQALLERRTKWDLAQYEAIYKEGRVTVHSPDSFVSYVARHGGEGTEVWMDLPARKVFAVLDGDSQDERGLRQHRVQMELLYTDQWKSWKALDRKYVRQSVLGEFIIDHYADFVQPNAAAMLNHATTFQAIKNVDFQSVENVKNGEKSISYIETIGQKQIPGTAELPEEVTFTTQIFEFGDDVTMMARWFYTIEDKNLLMKLLIDQVRETEHAAFTTLCEQLRVNLEELPTAPAIFYGCDR
ncbi:DUF2303 family protein [Changpingibacter yushuensis]|uniref:DUF2303 family protein n=1 Tax=Changpingibacter yushuensis TaxID=2758440 RepID=UPI00165E8E08|nr:DUF2303 family protein [Changpingibacter yushuensis]